MRLPARNQYPKEVRIGKRVWKVKFVKRTPGEDKDTLGLCDPTERTIYIAKGQSIAETLYTFVHEVIHAFEEEHKLKIKHKRVHQLERAIGDFILSNF